MQYRKPSAFYVRSRRVTKIVHLPLVGCMLRLLTSSSQLRQENRQTKLLAKAQDAWAEEVQPPPGADLELEGFVSPEELELLKRVYVHKDGLENIAQEMGTTKTALAKRVARIKEKFRKNYRESEKKFAEDRAQTASAGHDKVKGGNKQ